MFVTGIIVYYQFIIYIYEEEFILRKAVEQADSEGKEILMLFCRNRPIPQNCDEEATVESDGKNENATVENGES